MDTIDWIEKDFSVGIVKIDEQHRQLVGLLNALIKNADKPSSELFSKIFTTLVVYTRTHFTDEEKILRKMNYPGFEQHRERHQMFVNEVLAAKKEFDERGGGTSEMAEKMINFLRKWLINHIMGDDRQYGKYLLD